MSSDSSRAKNSEQHVGNGLKSMDVNDFELVHHDVDKQKDKDDVSTNENEDKKREYKNLVEKMKNEIKPFKRELLHDQEILKKLRSNLIDETKMNNKDHKNKQDSTSNPPKNDNNNSNNKEKGKNDPQQEKEGNNNNPKKDVSNKKEDSTKNVNQQQEKENNEKELPDENEADLKYKISSLKYDLMKRQRQIDELQNKIKSFSQKVDSLAIDAKGSPNGVDVIFLLKKELELIPDDTTSPNIDYNDQKSVRNLDIISGLNSGHVLELFIGSCFHIVNAILIVILLSVYYSRDKYTEKRVTALAILAAYVITNFISLYLTRFYITQFGSTVYTPKERTKTLLPHIFLLACCWAACVLLVYQVAKRYEDASTFVYNMLYLMGFCSVINLVLVLFVSKVWTKSSQFNNNNNNIKKYN